MSVLRVTTVGVGCAASSDTVKLPLAPVTRLTAPGCSDATVGSGATTLTAASAVVPFRVARTSVLPRATEVASNVAEVTLAGTTTVAGTLTTPPWLTDKAIVVGVDAVFESVTVRGVRAPSVSEDVGGSSDASDGAEAVVTVTLEVADDVPRLATTCAVPAPIVPTLTAAVSAPAGTVTEPATARTLLGRATRFTDVAELRTEFSVTVSVDDAPCSMRSVAGCSELTVAGDVTTLTWAVAIPPVPPSVMTASPAERPCTGIDSVVWPIA